MPKYSVNPPGQRSSTSRLSFAENGAEYFTYHYYDRDDSGRSKLNMRRLGWASDGWPIIVNVPEPCAVMLLAGALTWSASLLRSRVVRGR